MNSINYQKIIFSFTYLATIFFTDIARSTTEELHLTQPKIAIVLNSAEANVSLIDMNSLKVIRTVDVGKEPHHLLMSPDQKQLLIANALGNDVTLMNPLSGELTGKIPKINDPYQIGYSPNSKWFIVNGNRLDLVDLYRADGINLVLAKSIKLGKTPSHIAFTSDSKIALSPYKTLMNLQPSISIHKSYFGRCLLEKYQQVSGLLRVINIY